MLVLLWLMGQIFRAINIAYIVVKRNENENGLESIPLGKLR